VNFPPAVMGSVVYDSPAEKAGLKVGDVITAVNGRHPNNPEFVEFSELQVASALAGPGDGIHLDILRDGTAVQATVYPKKDEDTGLMTIGVSPATEMQVAPPASDEELAKFRINFPNFAALNPGDHIIAADVGKGRQVITSWGDYQRIIQSSGGHAVEIWFKKASDNSEAKLPTLATHLSLREGKLGYYYPPILGMNPACLVEQADDDSNLKTNDIIQRVGPVEYPSCETVAEFIAENPQKALDIVVLRDGKSTPVTIHTGTGTDGKGILKGALLSYDVDDLTIVDVDAKSSAARAYVPVGAKIAAINEKPVKSWFDVLEAGRAWKTGTPFSITLEGEKESHLIAISPEESQNLSKFRYVIGLPMFALKPYELLQRSPTYVGAISMGLEHTYRFVIMTYQTLRGFATGSIGAGQFHGIVFIGAVGYKIQEQQSFAYLLYFLGLISVNLAVINFLPLPIVDGGLFLMLVLEKIRGKPLPMNVQETIQRAGLALLGTVFLLVTVNDIYAMFLSHG